MIVWTPLPITGGCMAATLGTNSGNILNFTILCDFAHFPWVQFLTGGYNFPPVGTIQVRWVQLRTGGYRSPEVYTHRGFLNQILPLQKCTRGAGSVRGAGGCKRCTAWCHPPQQYWSQLTWAAAGAIAPSPGLSMADICPMPRHL